MSCLFETRAWHKYSHRQYFGKVYIHNSSTSEYSKNSFTTNSQQLSIFIYLLFTIISETVPLHIK